jgi:lipoate---protein ligase
MKTDDIPLHIITLNGWPIIDQLRLEEALLRADHHNWCLLNTDSPPAIVTGISGKPVQLIQENILKNPPFPLIRRFSGGGTVYIDQNTYFATFIFNSDEIAVPCYPNPIFAWTKRFYSMTFSQFDFKLIENDYTIGDRKFGGNAQYLAKNRWLHHTSFLWDFDEKAMRCLQMPPKTPHYRQNRQHHDFLCRLKQWIPTKQIFENQIKQALSSYGFQLRDVSSSETESILKRPHRQSTEILNHIYFTTE